MSLGPTGKTEDVKETHLQRVSVLGGNLLKSISKDPAERLFYFGIALLLIGLPLGLSFPVAYYIVLAVLGGIIASRKFLAEPVEIHGVEEKKKS